jgi:hypothetical protein
MAYSLPYRWVPIRLKFKLDLAAGQLLPLTAGFHLIARRQPTTYMVSWIKLEKCPEDLAHGLCSLKHATGIIPQTIK